MSEDYTNEFVDSISYIAELKEEIESLKKDIKNATSYAQKCLEQVVEYKKMLDMQTKLVVSLELEKIELTDKLKN